MLGPTRGGRPVPVGLPWPGEGAAPFGLRLGRRRKERRPGRKQPPSSRRARGAPCPSVFYLHFTPELSKSTVTVPSGLTVTWIRNERINLPSDRGLQLTTPVNRAVTRPQPALHSSTHVTATRSFRTL